MTEREWDGKWTRETRSTAYDGTSGCRAETVLAESSDYPAVTKSVTEYDFLGRAVSVATPLGVTSNFYDGATSRLLRVTRTGSPDTLYAYDALGGVIATALDVDGDGTVAYAGTDRITRTDTRYEEDESNAWWRVTASAIWNQTGVDAGLTSAVKRVRMTGLGGAAPSWTSANAILTAQSMTVDGHCNATLNSTYTDAGAASVWQVAESPFSTQAVIRVSMAGSPVTDISASCVTNTCAYDGFARQTAATDGRGNTSRTAYNALGQVEYTENAASNRTSYAYDALGRRVEVTDALTNTTYTAYDSMGNVIRTWGANYPVEYGYDSQGRRISMKTFCDENGAGDETRWLCDSVTGLLTNKVYADGKGTAYGYTTSGRLSSRIWARGVTTAYAYDATGQLTGIDYSDATPDVVFEYDRLGRVVSAVTAMSSNLFEYAGLDLVGEVQNGVAITRSYDGLGRSAGFNMGSAYIAAYGYDTFGHFASISSSVASASSVAGYSYVAGSGLLASMTNSAGFWWRRAYEQNRDLIASVENGFGGNTVSDFAYDNDANGRRERRVDSGTVTNLFANNRRGEVTGAVMGTGIYAYRYDDIGNRVFSVLNTVTNTYAANQLNQYTAVTPSVAVVYDTDGNTTRLGDWCHTWDAENRLVKSEPYGLATNGAVRLNYQYNHRNLQIAKITEQLSGRGAGYPLDPSQPGTWDAVETRRYVWDGYNIAAEIVIDEVTPSTNVTYYTWGLDLSGTMQGAGGVGGLLAVIRDDGSVYCPAYDANGNVTEYTDVTGAVRGYYEYSPFGEITVQSGDLSESFTHRFSTKPFDVTTGKIRYEFRPYDPLFGHWFSRDPIGIKGGVNEYGFVVNNAVNRWDYLGLKECECAQERIWMELGEKMRAAADFTLKNPIIVDLNFDKAVSKVSMFGPVYREYGGYICCNSKEGKVISTGPYPGSWRYAGSNGVEFYSDDPVLLARGGGTPTTGNITGDAAKQCPSGTTTIMFYHSHPPNSPNLSPGDIGFSNSSGGPIAGGGAGENYYWFYSPPYGWILVEY